MIQTPSRTGPILLTLWTASIFHHQSFAGACLGHGWGGPWPGVGVVEGEEYAPPRAGKRAGVGNFTEGLGFFGASWAP